ncbi:DUF4260 domain-containing protein [Celeribacter sp. SCSIO 80788]|jgi:hypothetical protein|uniref:DUF4260 domain-containing protein n=1 Tax=Celeribacter sp. SCSIO 80788 TaxID=3117013 RepID=UPI003DA5DE4D
MRETILWQRAEGALICVAALCALRHLGLPLSPWAMAALFFAPDLSFAAYAFGPRAGAFAYNLLHLYGFGACIGLVGLIFAQPVLAALGLLWIGHAGADRALGYGLKSPQSFVITHLGRIGKTGA